MIFPSKVAQLFIAAMLLVAGAIVVPFGPSVHSAQAATGSLTIGTAGASAEGSGWSYNAGSGTITLSTATVTISPSDVVAKLALGNLTIDVASLSITADIVSSSSNNLTLKSNGNINTSNGVDIETQGGNITFQSDSDASGVGSIRLGDPTFSSAASLKSNGGNITLSGGLDPATGYAVASSDLPSGYSAGGVSMYGYAINGSGGNVLIRGSGGTNSISTRAVIVRKNALGGSQITTTGTGTISITGDGGQIVNSTAWGVDLEENASLATSSGQILIRGKGNNSSGKNGRGLAIVNVTMQSTSGDITLEDFTDGSGSGYTGAYNGATCTLSTLGNISISADEIVNAGTWVVSGPSIVFRPYNTNSFTADLSIGAINATNSQNLVIGAPGNTTTITMGSAINTSGHVTMHGSTVALNASLTATNSNVYLYASSAVTQSGALVADGLALVGAGTFNLPNVSNNVRILAGGSPSSKLGALTFVDSAGGLIIGHVSALVGLYSSAAISVSTVGGNLNLTEPVVSSRSTGDTVVLYADKPAMAGTAGSGNILLSGNGALTVESGARALLYSGSQINSTGLIALVGGDANTRSSVDATTALNTITPALDGTGQYALFRLSEVVPTPTPTPTPTSSNNSTPASLPTTGFDFALLGTVALGLLLSGLAINLTSGLRRRRQS